MSKLGLLLQNVRFFSWTEMVLLSAGGYTYHHFHSELKALKIRQREDSEILMGLGSKVMKEEFGDPAAKTNEAAVKANEEAVKAKEVAVKVNEAAEVPDKK
ncbi:uncharacterized protein LOC132307074 [Cornus florida]|uniref:uncharacterized protein LOC132307074 n=1 Tax=Cornus florida TaxID=4283 RepID=UPI00289B4B63|nr:uncharacterized protein LOC132307074 [Cornus florida]